MPQESLPKMLEKVIAATRPDSIRVVVDTSQSRPALMAVFSKEVLQLEHRYLETKDGRRTYDQVLTIPGKAVSHTAYFCDGSQCASVEYDKNAPQRQMRISIVNEFGHEGRFGYSEAPEPLKYYRVGLTPLHEALPGAEFVRIEQVIGRDCDVYHFREVAGQAGKTQSLIYALDRETGIPLRVSAYPHPEQIEQATPNWVWEAKTVDRDGGGPIARTSTYASYKLTRGDDGRWSSSPNLFQDIRVEEVEFNGAVAKSSFWPTLQPGVSVFDSIKKASYEVPGGTKTQEPVAPVGPPIRATPDDWGYWPTGLGVGLSLTILAVALAVHLKSRR
jgi:hypothetical protein